MTLIKRTNTDYEISISLQLLHVMIEDIYGYTGHQAPQEPKKKRPSNI